MELQGSFASITEWQRVCLKELLLISRCAVSALGYIKHSHFTATSSSARPPTSLFLQLVCLVIC